MDKLKAEKAYAIINKKWLDAQAGKIAKQGRSEYSLEVIEIVYNLMFGKKLAPTHKAAVDELSKCGVGVGNAKAREIMGVVNDVFELGCVMGVKGRNRKQLENAGKVKKIEMTFNKFINNLFGNSVVSSSDVNKVLKVSYDA